MRLLHFLSFNTLFHVNKKKNLQTSSGGVVCGLYGDRRGLPLPVGEQDDLASFHTAADTCNIRYGTAGVHGWQKGRMGPV